MKYKSGAVEIKMLLTVYLTFLTQSDIFFGHLKCETVTCDRLVIVG